MLISRSQFLSSILALSLPSTAFSLPDYIRKGYTSCTACHVSPQGGGVLTLYGRGVTEELSTVSYEGQGSFGFTPLTDKVADPTGLFNLITADLQADARSVHIVSTDSQKPRRDILMEASVRAAFHVGKTTDIVISHGTYGRVDNEQQRNYYLALRTSKYLSISFGRFLPAYGINLDDHTAITRSSLGFGEGQESINLSVHFEDENFQTTFTKVLGQDIEATSKPGTLSYQGDIVDRYIVRSAVKLGSKALAGFSGLIDARKRDAGLFASYAPFRYLYVLAEYDNERVMEGGVYSGRNLYFARAGSEVFRGVTLGLDISGEKSDIITRQRLDAFLYLMPTPHLSMRLMGRKEGEQTNFIGMLHLWI